MKGTWTGYYKHESELIPEERRNQLTKFKISIEQFDGKKFSGTIEDDLTTGGTQGVGTVAGIKNGEKISFIKQMPIETALLRDGKIKTWNRKHPEIYYSGYISNENIARGQWKFKFGFTWFGIIPVPRIPISGIWEMKKEIGIALSVLVVLALG